MSRVDQSIESLQTIKVHQKYKNHTTADTMFGGEQLDEASLRAMREKYFGSEEHFNQLVAEGKFKSGNSEYSQVFARMVGEGREVMEVAGLMVQMGNMMTPGVAEEARRLRETNPQLYAMVGGVQPTPTADVVAKPPDRTQKMGWEVQMGKNAKKKSKINKVSEKIWISTSAPRVRENYPLKRGIQQRQTTPEGRSFNVSTTPPTSHVAPDDSIFAIEFPGTVRLGPPVDFLMYGNYQNANILSLEVPDTATTSKEGLVGRPAHFIDVDTEFITQHQLDFPGWIPPHHQWIGGSTKYRCEILCDVEKDVKYYTGKHTSVTHANRMMHSGESEPQHHHGNKLQDGCICQQRPTTIIVYGDEATSENKDNLSSIAISVSWDVSSEGDYITWKSFRHQPDGRVCKDQRGQKEMNNQNIYLRAFLCAADVQDTACLPGLCNMGLKAAYATGRLVEFADAVDRLVVAATNKYYQPNERCPGFDLHPYPETAFGYYAMVAGEAHEAAASLAAKVSDEQMFAELRRAVASYKFGAYVTSQRGAENRANYEMRCHMWQCLGLALRNYAAFKMVDGGTEHDVYYDMAERAYCWGLACIFPYEHDQQRQHAFQHFNMGLQQNLGGMLDFRHKSAAANHEACGAGMKDQRRRIKKKQLKQGSMFNMYTGNVIKGCSQCAVCGVAKCSDGSKLKRCSGCGAVWFCSATCQRAAWKEHKKVCNYQKKEKKKKTKN